MNIKGFLLSYILDTEWNVGFMQTSPHSITTSKKLPEVNWLNHQFHDRWFGDPFILEVNETHILLLVEEYRYKDHKGRISLLKVDKKTYCLDDIRTVILEPTHLSFPIYYHKGQEVYIYPESGESGKLKTYRFDSESCTAKLCDTIVDDPISDAVIVDGKEGTYLFAIKWPEPSTNEMLVYIKDGNRYELLKTLLFGNKIARNAGSWFMVGDKMIRPAQDCDRRYGHALIFQEVDLSNMKFSTINRFVPTSKRYDLGIHTFNYLDGIAVVDGYRYRHPWLAHVYAAISNTYHKLIGVDYRI